MKAQFSKFPKALLCNLFISLLFFSIIIPGIISDKNNTFQARDQNNWHLRQIEAFVDKPFNGGNYPSTTATTPGHHVVLSLVSKSFANGRVGSKILPIRIANALFGLGLILVLWWFTYLGGARNAIETTFLVLPFLFSHQFLGSAIWVMTDNGALLWACLTLLLVTLPTPLNRENLTLTSAGIFTALAVAWRQSYVWLIVPLFLRVVRADRNFQKWKLYVTTLLPPLLVVGYFLFLWHGLTPPEFASYHVRGFNTTAPIFIISLFGVLGLFYIGYLSSALQKVKTREVFWLIVISAIVGFGIATLFPTSYARYGGRWGGWLWEISRHLPSIHDRSILFLVLCPLGTVLISLWYKVTNKNKSNDVLIFVSMIAWIAAYTATMQTFQRYYELLILITLIFLASRQQEQFRKSYLGPLILAGLMGVMSLQQIVFS